MYIIDGIAYAGEPKMFVSVKSVRSVGEYGLLLLFSDGSRKQFDMKPFLDMPCYQPLKDKTVFDGAYVDCGTVVWNDGDIDIAPETLYTRGVDYTASEPA